jgi:hypothetical protein
MHEEPEEGSLCRSSQTGWIPHGVTSRAAVAGVVGGKNRLRSCHSAELSGRCDRHDRGHERRDGDEDLGKHGVTSFRAPVLGPRAGGRVVAGLPGPIGWALIG